MGKQLGSQVASTAKNEISNAENALSSLAIVALVRQGSGDGNPAKNQAHALAAGSTSKIPGAAVTAFNKLLAEAKAFASALTKQGKLDSSGVSNGVSAAAKTLAAAEKKAAHGAKHAVVPARAVAASGPRFEARTATGGARTSRMAPADSLAVAKASASTIVQVDAAKLAAAVATQQTASATDLQSLAATAQKDDNIIAAGIEAVEARFGS